MYSAAVKMYGIPNGRLALNSNADYIVLIFVVSL
jgi:hypothetical protein